VIHGCNGEQDMRMMGGIRKYMPKTWLTMLIATITIAGIPPLAGFFSKDEILAGAFFKRFETLGAPWSHVPMLCWILGIIAATFTAFYMFRLYFMTFEGDYRGAAAVGAQVSGSGHNGHDVAADHAGVHPNDEPKGQAGHHPGGHAAYPHESPISMTGVLMILAALSIVGGFVGLPHGALGLHGPNPFQRWLAPVLYPIAGEPFEFHHASAMADWILILISVAVAVTGIAIAWQFYLKDLSWSRPKALAARFPFAYRVLENKYYVDELYDMTVIGGTMALSRLMSWIDIHIVDGLVNLTRHVTVFGFGGGSDLFDRFVVDGAVDGVARLADFSSRAVRRAQTGMVQSYALTMGGGILLMALVYLFMKS
jgi:NADH:ubiquinone oxidoreductase subunit 5 (subunit L)/multisubunit Na+/H+ antiporter MnhA subunit